MERRRGRLCRLCDLPLFANYDNRSYQACVFTCLNAAGSDQKAFSPQRHSVEALSYESVAT
eukprot:5513937-Pleurochrysis_carterae.AAC.1